MARKKPKKKKKSRKQPWGGILVLLLCGILPYLTYRHGGEPLQWVKDQVYTVSQDVYSYACGSVPHPFGLKEGIEIPAPLDDRNEQIIRHAGYTVSYNADWCIPNWVAYLLTAEKAQGTVKRGKDFIPDPQVKGRSATTEDYKYSGYDRGHMAPAGDMKWSSYAMAQSFYLSNICPQHRNLNNGDWKILEEKGRSWALRYDSLYIVCGPIVEKGYATIGKNKVAVPQRFFKVFLRKADPGKVNPQGIGFLFENKAGSKPLAEYAVSIEEVERETGMDFFPWLPDDIKSGIERICYPEDWGL